MPAGGATQMQNRADVFIWNQKPHNHDNSLRLNFCVAVSPSRKLTHLIKNVISSSKHVQTALLLAHKVFNKLQTTVFFHFILLLHKFLLLDSISPSTILYPCSFNYYIPDWQEYIHYLLWQLIFYSISTFIPL